MSPSVYVLLYLSMLPLVLAYFNGFLLVELAA